MHVTTRRAGHGRLDVYRNGVRKGYVTGHLGTFRAFDANGRPVEDTANGFLGYGYALRREAIAATATA